MGISITNRDRREMSCVELSYAESRGLPLFVEQSVGDVSGAAAVRTTSTFSAWNDDDEAPARHPRTSCPRWTTWRRSSLVTTAASSCLAHSCLKNGRRPCASSSFRTLRALTPGSVPSTSSLTRNLSANVRSVHFSLLHVRTLQGGPKSKPPSFCVVATSDIDRVSRSVHWHIRNKAIIEDSTSNSSSPYLVKY